MANYFDTGILLTAGFSLSGQAPLDGRTVVELLTDLDTHIAENRVYEGMEVPEVLLSGDHKKIDSYRYEQSLKRTEERRPDLLDKNR